MISGSWDKTIKVLDIVTRQLDATLDAHTGPVYALAVSGRTLLSTGSDCTIGVWALGTWSHLRRTWVSKHVPDALDLLCSGFVVLFDSDTMDCRHTLRLDRCVGRLLSKARFGADLGKAVSWCGARRSGGRDRACARQAGREAG